MKKGVLFSSVIGLSLVLGSLAIFNVNNSKEYYQPRNQAEAKEGFQGGADWLHRLRANQVSGEIDAADVLAARAEIGVLNAKAKKSTLALQWAELGPDNIGGRTRAFLISKKTPGLFFAASVSGGLFRSTNSGSSWQAVNDFMDNLAVVSIAEAPNGDIYIGTGEDLYYNTSGAKSGGILGGGMFKSTDGGQTFDILSSTIPTSSGDEFASIGKIEIDPSNSQKIYMAGSRGIRISTDGGMSWSNPLAPSITPVSDMTMSSTGHVWIRAFSQILKSTDGSTFTEISSANPGATGLPRNSSGRMRIAVSPEDDNYVYVVMTSGGNFSKAYRTTDGGTNWTEIGSANSFLNPHNGQGNYNNALTVDSKNKDRILVGGVILWEWSLSNGWQQMASNSRFLQLQSLYVHSDVHHIVFHPTDKNKIYVCSDGGVTRSIDNGLSWVPIVKNYGTIQFYDIGVGGDGSVIGGTQDNSNILINPNAPLLAKTGVTLNSGDGGYADISKLNPGVIFLESQYGNALRSADGGGSFGNFFDLDRMAPNASNQPGSGFGFADFVAPFELYENVFDFKSTDFIRIGADSVSASVGLGGGKVKFDGKFTRPQASAEFLKEGVVVKAGLQSAITDANGNFVGDVSAGSFDPLTGNFSVTFNNPVVVEVFAKAAIKYDAGDTVILQSLTNKIPLTRVLPTALAPNQSTTFQDPIQSAFFMGLTGRSVSNGNNQGGIWMTRNAISNVAVTPTWYHIGNVNNGESPTCMAISSDGDVLYVGTGQGRVYRFSNISNARDSASADIDDFYTGTTVTRPNTSVITKSTMNIPVSGRAVTEINFDPRDKDKVIITLGNYGNTNYVYYSSNATATIPTFKAVTGNLPKFPVYTGIFNAMGDANQVIVGTDYGVWVTDDINANPVVWTQEITGFANVPVFDLVQKLRVRRDLQLFGNNEGEIYAGTHGRGIFRTMTTQSIGLTENNLAENSDDKSVLNLYPNPSRSQVFVPLNLTGRSDVVITVRDINGKLVRNMKLNKVSQDVENIELNISNLPSGTYIVTLMKGAEVISGKLVKQ